jgi:DtxR family transcriptional regulator, Mn-dependent transcriptional regulator
MEVSVSQENYLKTILKLERSEGIASNQAIAQNLDSTPAAVTGMLRKLCEEGLVEYEAYQGAKLTQVGEQHALSTVRKHRLWEVFLVEKLNFRWDTVHQLAEELEHIGNEDFVNRLAAFLGNPLFDPHGDPIPDAAGNIRERVDVVFSSEAEAGTMFVVCGVSDSSDEFLRHLNRLGIELGSKYHAVERFEFDGSMEWSNNQGARILISSGVSEKILIQVHA